MKNLLLIGAAALGLIAVSSRPASAFPNDWYTYVGADYQDVSLSFKSGGGAIMPSSLPTGGNIYLGERFGTYYAAELGYMRGVGDRSSTSYKTHISISGPTLDLYGYLPLFHSHYSLFGTIGSSYLDGSVSMTSGAVIASAVVSNGCLRSISAFAQLDGINRPILTAWQVTCSLAQSD
jgi:hypothetical protein